eukprot:scaffold392345_cov31-Attheya_sp.AAC.1
MQSLSSSSGDSQDMSHDERIEDDSQETSSYDFNYHEGHESDTPSYSTVHDFLSIPSLSSNSMFSCAYQSSLSDNASTTSGEKEVHNDNSSQFSSLSSTSANYIYESEDIDFSKEEEDEDMMDNLPPPIDLVEARLLELMMKYSVPLGSYKSFLEWAKISVNTKYNFDSSKKTFGANIMNHKQGISPLKLFFQAEVNFPMCPYIHFHS